MIFVLQTAEQASDLMRRVWPKVQDALKAGKTLRMEIKSQGKSRDQEEMYHALIGEIAKAMKQAGSQWSADDWKRLLIDQWAHETNHKGGKVVPSLDGERVVQLGLQSRKFTVEEGSEFIEWLIAWATEKGIEV